MFGRATITLGIGPHFYFDIYYYYCYNHFTGLPGQDGSRRNIYSLTYLDHHLTFISFFHLLRSMASSLSHLHGGQSFLHNLSPSPLWSTSWYVVWSPRPHTPYIYLPNQCLLFATYAHTIAVCFAVVPRLYYLFLVFLSTPYLEICLLPKHYTSSWPFSSLLTEVPPHFPFSQARSHFHVAYCCTSHTTAVQPPSPNQWSFLRPLFPASHMQHISDLHSKFALRPHDV